MVRLTIFVGVLCSGLMPAAFAQIQSNCPSNPAAGFRVVEFGSLTAAVWYPSSSQESAHSYTRQTVGSVAVDAPPLTCGKFPLIVFSHGYTGCGTQSVFITEQLARNGFVVVAPDHADAGCSSAGGKRSRPPETQVAFSDPSNWTSQTYVDRKIDIQHAIDGVLQSPVFGPMIDATRIAGMGHSLGGYTILGMAGGWSDWADPRICAAILLSPYSQPFIVQNTLSGVHIPVMYQGGTLDFGVTPTLSKNSGAYDATPAPKYFVELSAAGHFAWTNLACMRAATVSACLSSVPNPKLINDYVLAFLRRYVESKNAPLLSGSGVGLAQYRHAP